MEDGEEEEGEEDQPTTATTTTATTAPATTTSSDENANVSPKAKESNYISKMSAVKGFEFSATNLRRVASSHSCIMVYF